MTAGVTRWRWRSSAAALPATGRSRIVVPARSGSWPTAVGEQYKAEENLNILGQAIRRKRRRRHPKMCLLSRSGA